ncbi:MAG: transglycosylase-like protein, partial [Octadecabacter sp.]|nr:transglycosylase-like protein [Octadecabacter sp.]
MKQLFATTIAGFLLMTPASAQEVPAEPAFSSAFDAITAEDWDTAYALVSSAGDVSRDLVTWMRLRDGAGIFPDFTAFLAARPDWPGLTSVREQAERALTGTESPADVLVFFEGAEVETGEGAVAYADALIAQGRLAEAEQMLGRVWRSIGLDDAGHQAVINAYPDILAPHHEARADAMLWRWRRSDAANELPHLGEGYQALVRARIALIAKASDIEARISLVPDRLQNDAGLAYDRFNWLAGRGDLTDAMELLRARSTSAEALGQPWRWGSWRRIIARWQMRDGEAASAYALASQHFITPEEDNYSDLEWLSGYIALTYLDDPELAKTHFTRFDAAVSSPISKGRAGYWLGRAEEALGNADAAMAAYQAGARHQTTFYGLLSAERLGLPLDPDLAGGASFGDWQDSDLLTNDLIEAGLLLLGADQRG